MKAVIVDLLNGQAAALCDDGRVIKLADAGYTLGQIVEVHERKRRRTGWLRTLSAAAAAAVLLVGGGGAAAYAMPYGVVSLDVNPSIEYTINRFDYVLRVEGVNEDGRLFLDGIDKRKLVNRSIGEALEESITQLEAGDWLGGDSGEILLAAGTKKEDHSERLVNALGESLRRGDDTLEVRTLTVSEDEVDSARREGISAGRRHMLHEISENEGAELVPGEWSERPIRELFDRLERGPDMPTERDENDRERPQGESREAQPEERRAPAFSENAPSVRPEGGEPERQEQGGFEDRDRAAEAEREQPAEKPDAESGRGGFIGEAPGGFDGSEPGWGAPGGEGPGFGGGPSFDGGGPGFGGGDHGPGGMPH